MELLEAHQRAQETFAAVLQQVPFDRWHDPTPCPEWDVAALVDHVIDGNQRVQLRAGEQPVSLPDEPVAALAASAAAAHRVFAAPDGLTRPFELPFATIPGSAFICIRAGDAFAHAWDLATATGRSTDELDGELAERLLELTRPLLVPQLRGEAAPFGEEQPCPPDRSPADRFAAFLGRPLP
jgi:uncharacterized protein (TIGR03086 family)